MINSHYKVARILKPLTSAAKNFLSRYTIWPPVSSSAMSGEAVVHPEREAGDWRSQLRPDSRLRIVNKIMQTLKRHLPFSGEEGLLELKKIAERFEEKTYCAATSQSDYSRKISLKMLTMEAKPQNPMANPLQLEDAINNENPQDSGQNTF